MTSTIYLIIFICPWICFPLLSVVPNLVQAIKNLFGLYIFSQQAKYRWFASVWILVGETMRLHRTPRPVTWATWVKKFHLGRIKGTIHKTGELNIQLYNTSTLCIYNASMSIITQLLNASIATNYNYMYCTLKVLSTFGTKHSCSKIVKG